MCLKSQGVCVWGGVAKELKEVTAKANTRSMSEVRVVSAAGVVWEPQQVAPGEGYRLSSRLSTYE